MPEVTELDSDTIRVLDWCEWFWSRSERCFVCHNPGGFLCTSHENMRGFVWSGIANTMPAYARVHAAIRKLDATPENAPIRKQYPTLLALHDTGLWR